MLMSPWPKIDDVNEFAISGKSVPIETRRSPIMKGKAPKASAKIIELSCFLTGKNHKENS